MSMSGLDGLAATALRCIGLLVLVLLASVVRAASPESPEAWLERMNVALSELTYQGEFSYFHGGDLSSLQLAHAVVDGTRHERLVHLNGSPREIIRKGDRVTCILHPGDRLLDLDESIPAGPFAQAYSRSLTSLPDDYSARFGPSDRIAGRDAIQIEIAPASADRYGYRLWLDRETALLLRSELVDGSDRPLEIFQFVRIEIGGDVDMAMLEAPDGDDFVQYHLTFADDEAERESGQVDWEPGWLPSGFEMASWDIRRVPAREHAVASMVYSDGLASFSIFLERAPDAQSPVHHARHGATVAVMRRVSANTPEPWLVTVVGEVPMETAERVAEHVRPLDPG